MKYFFIGLISCCFSLLVMAGNPVMLTCTAEEDIATEVDKINDELCVKDKFLEITAKKVFDISFKKFDGETVNKIILDDVSNPNWLAQKGIYDLREHKLCLEKSCEFLMGKCKTRNNHQENEDQLNKCLNMVDNIFEVQKTKIKVAVIENQRRKTRSTWREKFRAIEVRSYRYFIPNLINFAIEFQRFTEKVTSFVLTPLS